MSFIDKLSIRGVRAFSPDDEVLVQFYSPLTMIVGENGCGKTTIIESLRYVCSGIVPPGAGKGQSFINDPKLTNSTETKASIKLRFKNVRGETMVASRSMRLKQNKKSMSFSAIDGVVTHKDATTGQKASQNYKCTEMDKHIPYLLGVSRSVLENVIFCHQEDSNWPLADSAVLKKKFDDLFESTRYSKALESVNKSRKNYVAHLKDIRVDLARCETEAETGFSFFISNFFYQKSIFKIAKEVEENMNVKATELSELERNHEGLSVEIELAEERLRECMKILNQSEEIQEEIDEITITLRNFDKQIEDIKKTNSSIDYNTIKRHVERGEGENEEKRMKKELSKFDEVVERKKRGREE